MKATASLLFSAIFICFLLVGCGGSNTNTPANLQGKVTYKGAPVTGGDLMFYYDAGGAYPATISADGTFSATGLPAGTALVTVNTEALNPKKKTPQYGGGRGGMSPPPEGVETSKKGTYVAIPAKYHKKETSDLKVEIKPGSQELEVTIPG